MKFWNFINWTFLGDIFILCLSALFIVLTLAAIITVIYLTWEEVISPKNRGVEAKVKQIEAELKQKYEFLLQREFESMKEETHQQRGTPMKMERW